MTPTRILVTGAGGFVGGRFVARFRDRPDLVLHGVGRRPLADPDYTTVDLSRPFDLAFEPDVVIHAAARAAPWGTAEEYRRDNVEATRQVLDFCRRQPRPPRLIHVSSSSVFYRHGPQLGLTEDSPIGPRFVNRLRRDQIRRRAAGPGVRRPLADRPAARRLRPRRHGALPPPPGGGAGRPAAALRPAPRRRSAT